MERIESALAAQEMFVRGAMATELKDHIADRTAGPESLFRQNYATLVRSLAVASGDREADDAVQDAFVQLCLHWKRVSKYDNPVAWVRHVAINRLSNHRRSLRRGAAALLRLRSQEPRSGAKSQMQADLEVAVLRVFPSAKGWPWRSITWKICPWRR